MFIVSKFKFWLIFLIVLFLCFVAFLSFEIILLRKLFSNTEFYVILFFLICLWLWLLLYELKLKAVKIKVEESQITFNNFFGLGVPKSVLFSELDGYQTASHPSSFGGKKECLYLIKEQGVLVRVLEQYHSNYPQIKQQIITKVPRIEGERESAIYFFGKVFDFLGGFFN